MVRADINNTREENVVQALLHIAVKNNNLSHPLVSNEKNCFRSTKGVSKIGVHFWHVANKNNVFSLFPFIVVDIHMFFLSKTITS